MVSGGAVETADALIDYVCRFGNPEEIQMDRGSQFINSLIEELARRINIQPVVTNPYSKQENGRRERANKEVRHLRALLYHRRIRYNWHMMLPFVRRIMNSTKHVTTAKFSPVELLFAGASRVNHSRVFSDDEQPVLELTHEEYSKWMIDRLACQRVVLDGARELRQAYDKHHLEDYNPEDLISFQINNLILADL
jgi:transposase InsO family protein